MIKTDAQRDRTQIQIEGFQRAKTAEDQASGKRAAAIRGSYEGMIRQLQDEVREYDQLKSGEFGVPSVDRLDRIAEFIVKLRIAKGVTQTELSKRLGVSKQVISRHEEDDYQGASITRLQEILDALGVHLHVTMTAR